MMKTELWISSIVRLEYSEYPLQWDRSDYFAVQEVEISCAAIKQKIEDILTELDQLDRK